MAAVSYSLVKTPEDPATAAASLEAEEAIKAQVVWPAFPPAELALASATGTTSHRPWGCGHACVAVAGGGSG